MILTYCGTDTMIHFTYCFPKDFAFLGHPEAWHKVWGFAGWLVDPRRVKTGGSRDLKDILRILRIHKLHKNNIE